MTHGYVNFPGAVGSSITTPDHASLDVTNDLEIKVLVWLDGTGQKEVLLTKGDVDNDTSASFELTHETIGDDSLTFRWRDSTTSLITATSDPGLATQDTWIWYRVTVAYSSFIGEYRVTFWSSIDLPTTPPASVNWDQYGPQFIQPSGPDIQVSTHPLTIGMPAEDWMVAKIGYVELRDAPSDLGGVIVADPDFRDGDQITTPNTVFTDSTGKAWTVNSPAMWVADESADPPNESDDPSSGIRKPPR